MQKYAVQVTLSQKKKKKKVQTNKQRAISLTKNRLEWQICPELGKKTN